jgi:hypothetical protein
VPEIAGTVEILVREGGNESYPDRYTRLEFTPAAGRLEAIPHTQEQGVTAVCPGERLTSFKAGAVEGCKSEPTRRSPDDRYFAVCSPISPYEVRLKVVDSANNATLWSETFQEPGGPQHVKHELIGFGWNSTSQILVILMQSYSLRGGIGGLIGFMIGHPQSLSAVHLTFVSVPANSHYNFTIAEKVNSASVWLVDWTP